MFTTLQSSPFETVKVSGCDSLLHPSPHDLRDNPRPPSPSTILPLVNPANPLSAGPLGLCKRPLISEMRISLPACLFPSVPSIGFISCVSPAVFGAIICVILLFSYGTSSLHSKTSAWTVLLTRWDRRNSPVKGSRTPVSRQSKYVSSTALSR